MDCQMTGELQNILVTVQTLAEADFDDEAVRLLDVAMDFIKMNERGWTHFPQEEMEKVVVVPLPKRKLAGCKAG